MASYIVRWEIVIEADSAVEAAMIARGLMAHSAEVGPAMLVQSDCGCLTEVDLLVADSGVEEGADGDDAESGEVNVIEAIGLDVDEFELVTESDDLILGLDALPPPEGSFLH